MHELLGHAIPFIAGRDTGNAVKNENKAAEQLPAGKNQQRQGSETHVEF